MLHAGWRINHKRVQRLWRREGMRVPRRCPWGVRPGRKRRRLGDSSNSCVLHKAKSKNHVWSYDFVFDRTEDGRQRQILALPILLARVEFTREDLCTHVAHSITGADLVAILAGVMEKRGCPENIRSDNGPEFAAHAVRNWLASVGTKTIFVEPGSPSRKWVHRILWAVAYATSCSTARSLRALPKLAPKSSVGAPSTIPSGLTVALRYKTPPADFAASCAPLGLRSAPSSGAQLEGITGAEWRLHP